MGNLERAKNITTMEKLVQGTVQNSTSGTSIDFTSIPSWVKRITVMFNGVSTNGSSIVQIQLGDSGGIENSGYVSTVVVTAHNETPAGNSSTSGIITEYSSLPSTIRNTSIELINIQSNTWLCSGSSAYSNVLATTQFCGSKTLSTTLDRIRITTVNGTDTFDAGQINIMYEG